MRLTICIILAGLLAGCGTDQGRQPADFCECATAGSDSGLSARACSRLTKSMSIDQIAEQTIACRRRLQPAVDGIDTCFCLRTYSEDAQVQEVCRSLISEETTPEQLNEMMLECAGHQR